jgi:hypothetical protein
MQRSTPKKRILNRKTIEPIITFSSQKESENDNTKLGSDKLKPIGIINILIKNGSSAKIGSQIIKILINFTFWGGFAVDADFGDGFSGSIEGPKIVKNQ